MPTSSVKFTVLAFALAAVTACGEAGVSGVNAEDALLSPGGGGGDKELQTTQAAPPPLGDIALNVETLASGLETPWAIAFLPNDDILVSERPGRIRIIRDGVLLSDPVVGTPDVLAFNQGGLFDILPHPNFTQNNTVFIAYAHGERDDNWLRVSRALFEGDQLRDVTPIYDATPTKDTGHHFGGRLVWAPDGTLFISIGEGSRYKEKAQDKTSSFGAVVRINEDGSFPADNPDFGPDAAPGLYSKGHRNPQGLDYDAERNVLWSHEHGPKGGDEINIVEPGANYGWPAASYGVDYSGARITPFTEYEGAKQPFHYWTPSIAPSGLAVYRGALFDAWNGDLLIGALAGSALHRVVVEGDRVVNEERYIPGDRIRDVRVGPDGAIYIATEVRGDTPDGKILRLTPQQ